MDNIMCIKWNKYKTYYRGSQIKKEYCSEKNSIFCLKLTIPLYIQ